MLAYNYQVIWVFLGQLWHDAVFHNHFRFGEGCWLRLLLQLEQRPLFLSFVKEHSFTAFKVHARQKDKNAVNLRKLLNEVFLRRPFIVFLELEQVSL